MTFEIYKLIFQKTVNGHPTSGLGHRTHQLTAHQPGNLQKLLMNGNGVSSSSSISTISIPAIAQGTNGNRLAPGGAELNLLPPNSMNNGAIYRNQRNLIVKGENSKCFFLIIEKFNFVQNKNKQNLNLTFK